MAGARPEAADETPPAAVADRDEIVVRRPVTGEGRGIAIVHIRSWQVGYEENFPRDYLDSLSHEFDSRAARWEEIVETEAPQGQLLVATLGGTIGGWASFGPAGRHNNHGDRPTVPGARLGEVYGFYVHPDQWRHGIGRALMDRTVEALAALGFGEAVLWVLEDNPRARGFYEATGWRFDNARSVFARGDAVAPEVRYRREL